MTLLEGDVGQEISHVLRATLAPSSNSSLLPGYHMSLLLLMFYPITQGQVTMDQTL